MIVNFLYQGIYQILALILPLITIPYTSRVLGAEGIGLYSYSYAVVSYFVSFANMGINIYGNRGIAATQNDKDKRSQLFCDLLTIQMIFSLSALLVYVIMIGAGAWENKVAFLVQGIYIIGQAFDINWLYFGMEKFKITVIRNLIVKIFTTVLIFVLIKEPADLIVYLLILAIGTVAGNSAVWLFVKQYITYKRPILVNIKQYIKPIIILLIPSFAVKIYTQMDKIFVEHFCGLMEVGYYENSEKIISISLVLITALSTVMLPRMANLSAENKKEEFNSLFQKVMAVTIWLTIALMFGIIGISDNFVLLYLGENFSSCIVLVIVLAITIPFKGCAEIIRRGYIIPQKCDYIYVISVFSGAGVNIIINFLLVPYYGAIGAAVGTVMAEAMVFFIQAWKIKEDINMYKYIRKASVYIGIGLFMLFCVKEVNQYTSNLSLILSVLLQIMAGIGCYLAGTCVLRLLRFGKSYFFKNNRG